MRALIGRVLRWFLDAAPRPRVALRLDGAGRAAVNAEFAAIGKAVTEAENERIRAAVAQAVEEANDRLLREVARGGQINPRPAGAAD